jgi:hypothetical protein
MDLVMGIRPKFTQSDLDNMFAVKLARIEDAIMSRLQYIGETFVNNARANGTYNDITGNLRSSVCYVVLKNGVKKSPGSIPEKSRAHVAELVAEHSSGYVLIVVAGMDYAAAVESKGKDVLTASSIIAKAQLQQAIKNFKNKLSN